MDILCLQSFPGFVELKIHFGILIQYLETLLRLDSRKMNKNIFYPFGI
jgi:hypothetical protein